MSEQEYDKEQLRILRNAFKAFDNDERGYIEHADVTTILEILGQKLDDKAIKALIAEVDKGTTGRLDFNQFCRLAARFVEVEEDTSNLMSELKEAFRVYDREGKGYLSVQTLRDILHELDDKLTPQDLDMIIEEIDADGSGTVDFDEFMQVMTGKNFFDLTLERRFSIDTSRHNRHCHIPANRMRLHRRIEWHFERFFEQFKKNPFNFLLTSSSYSSSPSPSPPSSSSSCTKMCNSIVPSVPSPSVRALRNIFECKCKETKPVLKRKPCYRPVFRPRFPKWIPILTLYREAIQNPFRCHCRYMIAQHE